MEPEVIGDRYELQEPVGRGGMATIFRAVDLRMGRMVAVKILRDVYSSDPKFVTRFQREARAASALQHPNIVQVFDYGQSGESYYIVMEFIDGTDLRRYLKRQGTLSPERTLEIAHDVALGLGAAHRRGIVHRDVKPQNILLNDDGLVKLTDFGIASMYKDAEAERLTTTGMTLGTVQYYAPEQAQGEIVSPAADIYALGIVMYELLTGRTPFDGDTPVAVAMRHIQEIPAPPSSLNPTIPPGLERIILRCLEKDPRDRYRDGDALAYALENVGRAPSPRRTGISGPQGRPPFAPIGLPSNDPRGASAAYPSSQYGAPVAVGGPQGAGYAPLGTNEHPGYLDDGAYDAPTAEGFSEYGVSTRPFDPAGGTVPRMTGPNGAAQGTKTDERRKRGPVAAVIIGSTALLLVLSCVLLLGVTGAWAGLDTALFSSQTTSTPIVNLITVPSLVGKQLTEAQAEAGLAGLKVNTPVFQKSNQPQNQVLAQDPAANTKVNPGAALTLTVSAGPGLVAVPDFSYSTHPTTSQDACQQLNQLQLNCNLVNVVTTEVPTNYVVATDPPAGTQITPGTKVTVKVSIGGPTPTATLAPTATPVQPTATQGTTPVATPSKTACPSVTPPGSGTPTPTPCS